jgi:hypothetical protein
VHNQRAGTGGGWTTVESGSTDTAGTFATTISGRTAGTTERYRAYLEASPSRPTGYADPDNNLWSNWTDSFSLVVGGSGAASRVVAESLPTAPTGTPVPTTTTKTASLNGEYFRLTNRTKAVIDLKGWTVRDAANHVYTFPAQRVGAGNSVYVHTGKGTDGKPAAHRYWARTGHLWNNGGDSASLRTGAGKTIDSCRYTGSSKGYTTC